MRQRELIKVVPNEYGALHVHLQSGEDDYEAGCTLSLAAWRWYVTIRLPQWVLRPYREKVVATWDPETVARMGRDWYWHIDERRYGVSLQDNHLNISLGRQTRDSSTEQRWGCFLPWSEWRQVRHTLCNAAGEPFWSQTEREVTQLRRLGLGEWFERLREATALVPKRSFLFTDFDGAVITAATYIEERECRLGTKWFKWLGWIAPKRVKRSLSIEFDAEVGTRKGSWKGGTRGHGIDLLPGELHEAAFRRYCEQGDRLTYQGAI